MSKKIICGCSIFIIFLYMLPLSGSCQENDEFNLLKLYYKENELVESPTRAPKSILQTAENVTVITAEDIEAINAHTLTDVLRIVTGIQVDTNGGIGGAASVRIQGSEYKHSAIYIDGVLLNNLSDNYADIGMIPVQHIRKIEIIKGPASSVWGSSLGGVINIITKEGNASKPVGGTLSASYGENSTGDNRAELSGGTKDISYYLFGGNVQSDGFMSNNHFYENNAYTKLKARLSDQATLIYTLGYNQSTRGLGDMTVPFFVFFDGRSELLFSTLSLNYQISSATDITVSVRGSKQNVTTLTLNIPSSMNDSTMGTSAKIRWQDTVNTLVVGTDYDNSTERSEMYPDREARLERWALFANDTILINKFSITPGIRYDYANTYGSFTSPSLGITYSPDETTVYRLYAARGFSMVPLSYYTINPDLKIEKIWSVQAGAETSAIRFIWLKTNIFVHYIDDALFVTPGGGLSTTKEQRQGFEAELKTQPVYDTSFTAGFFYVDAKDRNTHNRLRNVPQYTLDTGLEYNKKNDIKIVLKGHYIWWNASSDLYGEYDNILWDLYLTKTALTQNTLSSELFFSLHNIFEGSQHPLGVINQTPGRWIEAGIRLKF